MSAPLVYGQNRPDAAEWGQKFFAYLEKQKKASNPALLQLVSCLGNQGRCELAASIYPFLCSDWKGFCKAHQPDGQRVIRRLSKAMRDLRHAAVSYRELLTLAPELGIGIVLGADAPPGLPDWLEKEEARLRRQLENAKIAFSKKRLGMEPFFILFRLQEFIAEFARRRSEHLPEGMVTHLAASDLADLLEAGKNALGLPENETFPQPLEKALRRFRESKNAMMHQRLRDSAREAVDRLWPRAS